MDIEHLLSKARESEKTGDARISEIRALIPQAITSGQDIDLNALEQSAKDVFGQRYNNGEVDPSEVDNLAALADIVDAVRGEAAALAEAQAERDRQVAELAERINATSVTDEQTDDGQGTTDAGEDAEEEPVEDAGAEAETTPEPDTGSTTTPDSNDQPGESAPAESARELVTASADRRRLSTPSARDINAHRRDNGKPDRKSTRLNSSHVKNSYAVFCLKK